MSGSRRKNTPVKQLNAADNAAARTVAIPKNAENGAAPTVKPAPERIGDVLRQARLAKNDDLYLIADYLRIKPAFLIALENSRYDEFPADAYIIGFLRTYANFLGVDGKEAVDRYRYEMAGRRKKPVLSMPTPVSEGRAPSAVIMVGATIAVLLIYAVWYSISSSNRAEVNVPPALPVTAQTAAPATAETPSAAAGLTAPVTAGNAPAPTAAAPGVTVAPAVGSASSTVPPVAPGILVTSGQAPTATAAAAATATPPAPAATADGKNEGRGKVYGDPATVSRVIIRATGSSWVMVTDDSGKAVFDHVMKAGDVYKVPNKPGLSLTTGNGSGIVLSLDGVDLPKISTGAPRVIRGIALDPDHLTGDLPASDR